MGYAPQSGANRDTLELSVVTTDRADHLRELELGENATAAEVRQAYRDLARVWHPDRFASDPRVQAKATEKLRRVIEAYEFLQAHPHADAPPGRSAPRAEPPQPQAPHRHERPSRSSASSRQRAWSSPNDRRTELAQALAQLHHRVDALHQRVEKLDRRALAAWEPRAWAALGFGIVLPFAAIFILPKKLMINAVAQLWFISGVSSVLLLVLAAFRFVRIREETEDEVRAIHAADVTCGRCGREVVGWASPATAARALIRTQWASTHLKCPHCRRAFA